MFCCYSVVVVVEMSRKSKFTCAFTHPLPYIISSSRICYALDSFCMVELISELNNSVSVLRA